MKTPLSSFIKPNSTGKQSTSQKVQHQHIHNSITPFDDHEQAHQNQFACVNCQDYLEELTLLKKSNIVIEYQNARLKQEIEKVSKDNRFLKDEISKKIKLQLNLPQSQHYLTIKQDLEAELLQCKIINQMIISSKIPQEPQVITMQECLLEKLILQEQLEQRNRIIEQKSFYPIYHYDERIQSLKNAVKYFYKMAHHECQKVKETIKVFQQEMKTITKDNRLQISKILEEKFCHSNLNYLNQLSYTLDVENTTAALNNTSKEYLSKTNGVENGKKTDKSKRKQKNKNKARNGEVKKKDLVRNEEYQNQQKKEKRVRICQTCNFK